MPCNRMARPCPCPPLPPPHVSQSTLFSWACDDELKEDDDRGFTLKIQPLSSRSEVCLISHS